MKMTGAELLIQLLERQGIETIAGIPGGANLPMYDALFKSKIRHILARHEQGAGFIAHGQARSTGKAAVCFATSGPGATNLMTAIADAKLDSVPIIAITGQVPLSMIGTDAFQEVDTYGMTVPITKHNFLVRSAKELLTVVPEAFRIAESDRPGPVLIDIPKDVQKAEVEFSTWPEPGSAQFPPCLDTQLMDQVADRIRYAKKPMLFIGGGVHHSNAQVAIAELAHKNNIPVISTLNGLGGFDPEDPLFCGMLGMHGARYTNIMLEEIDLLLAFGTRFDDRATGKVDAFCPQCMTVHVDIDASEINKIKSAHLAIKSDLNIFLYGLLPKIDTNERAEWIDRIQEIKNAHPFVWAKENVMHPLSLIERISQFVDEDTIVTTDVGQHQMWVAQVYPFKKPRTLLTSGGLGTMGFGLPAAIGASLEHPDKRVLCFTGDGSILMNIQELATLAELKLPVTVILLNNHHLGLVRQQQELFYNKNYIASKFEWHPDFSALSIDFGIPSIDLDKPEKLDELIKESINCEGPCLLHIPIDASENVMPMVAPGAANSQMIGGES